MIEKGNYVEIKQVVLNPGERSSNIPEDTKTTSLILWAKGFLLEDSEIGKVSKIVTMTQRTLEGVVTEVNPRYMHDFGELIPEVLKIGIQAKSILWGDNIE